MPYIKLNLRSMGYDHLGREGEVVHNLVAMEPHASKDGSTTVELMVTNVEARHRSGGRPWVYDELSVYLDRSELVRLLEIVDEWEARRSAERVDGTRM